MLGLLELLNPLNTNLREGSMKKGALLIALMSLILALPARADDCRKLVELYNKATESRDIH